MTFDCELATSPQHGVSWTGIAVPQPPWPGGNSGIRLLKLHKFFTYYYFLTSYHQKWGVGAYTEMGAYSGEYGTLHHTHVPHNEHTQLQQYI